MSRPEAPRATWWQSIWQRFWALPSAIAIGSLLLGVLLPELDAALEESPRWVFEGGVDGARSLLGSIAGAMISVTGLVFSITIVVLQLASSQFTPRILGTFLDSRITQVTLGVFTGSFLYALTVLRSIRGGDEGRVPQMAVTGSYLFVILAVAMFLAFIHHITTSVQVSQTMSGVRRRTLATIDRLDRGGEAGSATSVGWSPRPGTPRAELFLDDRTGYVTTVDSTRLVKLAADCDAVAELTVGPGGFLAPGQPIGRLWGREELSEDEQRRLIDTLYLRSQRSLFVDHAFGLRQLLDIAERALSPGTNDPTTAIQAINELHVLLRALARRPDPSPYLLDKDGVVRGLYPTHRYADLLETVVDEISHYGADSVRVVPYLLAVLDDLAAAARPEHRDATRRAVERVRDQIGS